MNIKEEVVKRLQDGESVRQVTGSYRSRSEVVEGVRIYLGWLERRTEDTRARLDAAEKKRVLEEAEVKRLRLEKGTLEKEIAALRDNDKELQEKVDASIKKLKQVGSRLEEYKRQGFDEDLFLKLKSIEGKTAKEVWSALKDVDAAQRLRDEAASSRERLEVANKEFALVVRKKCRVARELSSLERKMSRIRGRLSIYQEILDLVDLAVANGLKMKEVQGLLEQLLAGKSLLVLRREIGLAEVRVAELRRVEGEARARLGVIGDYGVKAIENLNREFIEVVGGELSKAKMGIQSLMDSFRKNLERMNALTVDVALLQKQKEEIKSLILPAQLLFNVLESPDSLKLVPLPLVVQLLERLSLFGEVKFPDGRVPVHYDTFSGELHVMDSGILLVKISSVIRLTVEVLRQQLIKLNKENQA